MDGKTKGFKEAYELIIKNSSKTCIYSYFNKVDSQRTQKGNGINTQGTHRQSFIIDQWIHRNSSIDGRTFVKQIRKSVFELKLQDIKQLYIYSVN